MSQCSATRVFLAQHLGTCHNTNRDSKDNAVVKTVRKHRVEDWKEHPYSGSVEFLMQPVLTRLDTITVSHSVNSLRKMNWFQHSLRKAPISAFRNPHRPSL